MYFRLDQAAQILARTPLVLSAWLQDLPDDWIHGDEGPDTFSPFEVVGHLIRGELVDWLPRARIILDHGEDRAFEPFDRFAHRRESRGKSMQELLAEFAALRRENLALLAEMELTEADLDRTGTHPELGRVSLRELLATWVAHDLGHLAQIARVMAKQYGDEVGPWTQYLRVLSDRPTDPDEEEE